MDNESKKLASAKNLIDGITEDKHLLPELEVALARRKTARRLAAIRTLKGISQAEIAVAMGCSQSRVSKLECAEDDKWSVEDMRSYAHAVGYVAHLGILPVDMTPLIPPKSSTIELDFSPPFQVPTTAYTCVRSFAASKNMPEYSEKPLRRPSTALPKCELE